MVDWAIEHDIKLSVEDVVERAIVAGATIVGKNSKKYYERNDERLKREKAITAEQLLAYCKEYGTGKEAEVKISQATGLTTLTIRTYITRWKIKELLSSPNEKITESKPEEKIIQTEVNSKENNSKDQPAAVSEKTEKVGINPYPIEAKEPLLKVTNLEGKIFDYQFVDGKIYPNDKTEDQYVVIYPEQLDNLIAELEELKNYVK